MGGLSKLGISVHNLVFSALRLRRASAKRLPATPSSEKFMVEVECWLL